MEGVTDVDVSINDLVIVGLGNEDAVYSGCCMGHDVDEQRMSWSVSRSVMQSSGLLCSLDQDS